MSIYLFSDTKWMQVNMNCVREGGEGWLFVHCVVVTPQCNNSLLCVWVSHPATCGGVEWLGWKGKRKFFIPCLLPYSYTGFIVNRLQFHFHAKAAWCDRGRLSACLFYFSCLSCCLVFSWSLFSTLSLSVFLFFLINIRRPFDHLTKYWPRHIEFFFFKYQPWLNI